MSNITLTQLDSQSLPSQEGKKGRPRKHGRATILLGAGSTAEGRKARLAALATVLGVEPKTLALYHPETDEHKETYVVKSVDKDLRLIYVEG